MDGWKMIKDAERIRGISALVLDLSSLWSAGDPVSAVKDVKTSGHRTLERMARHFHSMDLIIEAWKTWHGMSAASKHTTTIPNVCADHCAENNG